MHAPRASCCLLAFSLGCSLFAACAVDVSPQGAAADAGGAELDAAATDVLDDAPPSKLDASADADALACAPKTSICLDAQTVGRCDESSGKWLAQPCPDGAACALGRCEAPGCKDSDGDGFGSGACPAPDCDDANPQIAPGRFDLCEDGIDADCDGFDPPCSCDPIAQDCPGGSQLMCALGAPNSYQCMASGHLPAGERCPLSADCKRGTLCVSFQAAPFACATICDFNTGDGCQNDEACSTYLVADNGIAGICTERERCDITREDACPSGQKCYPLNERYGDCRPATGVGGIDAPCDPDDIDQCGPGLFCAIFGGGRTVCLPACNTDRGNNDCILHDGATCQAVPLSLDAAYPEFTLDNFGFCIQ